ncbi:MAG: OsmC family protein [Proteobacteria bacterium]|nr:OsmC family protein [Pseudomonadota bacterium]
MNEANIAGALQRVRSVLQRRPDAADHVDDPVRACWKGGMHVVSHGERGFQVATDMPRELGGGGVEITPGSLLRAGLAACLATRIAMEAAERGVALARLEVIATSRSDVRGLLAMPAVDGAPVPPEPRDFELQVSIAAAGVDPSQLEEMVRACQRSSPVAAALRHPATLRIEASGS